MTGPLPQDIKPLTSLRIVAALWALVFYLKDHFGLALGQTAIVAQGYLALDLFFILSGFTLAHAHLRELESGRFSYGAYLKHRLARLYPLYALSLLALMALGAAGLFAAPVGTLAPHALLAQSWGVAPGAGWNWPAWTLSAAWGAAVVFPLIAIPAIRLQRPVIVLFWVLVLCLFAYFALDAAHLFGAPARPYAEITWKDGLLRALPSFTLGVALYGYAQEHGAPKNWAWPITGASAAFILFVAFAGYWPGWSWIGFAGLIYGLAETARHRSERALGGRVFVLLGASTYALAVLFLPIDILYRAVVPIGAEAGLGVRVAALIGEIVVCVAIAVGAHLMIDKPLRDLLQRADFRRMLARARTNGMQRDALRGRSE